MKLGRLLKTIFMIDFITGLLIALKEVFKSKKTINYNGVPWCYGRFHVGEWKGLTLVKPSDKCIHESDLSWINFIFCVSLLCSTFYKMLKLLNVEKILKQINRIPR